MKLLERTTKYLEKNGWYFDAEVFRQVWEREPVQDDILRARFWTVPQWADYWSSDHLEPIGPKPKRRRYEKLEEAIMSQILREEQPEIWGRYFE